MSIHSFISIVFPLPFCLKQVFMGRSAENTGSKKQEGEELNSLVHCAFFLVVLSFSC